MSDVALLRVGCACGWEVVGGEDEVVAAVLDHGERIHNMRGTREQVLAQAERWKVPGSEARAAAAFDHSEQIRAEAED